MYMDEHEALRDCMEDKGYSFSTMHSLADHFDAMCYRPTPEPPSPNSSDCPKPFEDGHLREVLARTTVVRKSQKAYQRSELAEDDHAVQTSFVTARRERRCAETKLHRAIFIARD